MRWLLTCALLTGSLLPAWPRQEPAEVSVRLFSGEQPREIRVTTPGGEDVLLDARAMEAPFRSEPPVTIRTGSGAGVRVGYPVDVSARDGALFIVTRLPLEDYVAAVLAGEALGFQSEESLKAMAVAVRTYATYFDSRHDAEGFDFCDMTHCQDFRITAVDDRLRKAVEATAGQVLEYDGRPIPAYYHQDCGGVTEPRAAYLRLLEDAFCVREGRSPWTSELSPSDLEAALGWSGVYAIEVIERTSSGRAGQLRVGGLDTHVVGAEAFRLAIGRNLGWDKLPSDLYEVRPSIRGFVFEGYGAGHGIGLCQHGAAVMGEGGYSYTEILAYYYPNTTVAF